MELPNGEKVSTSEWRGEGGGYIDLKTFGLARALTWIIQLEQLCIRPNN